MELKLNLGSGNDYLDGYINVDLNSDVRCDLVLDVEKEEFPWLDDSADEIIAKHLVEHLWDRDKFMNKCWNLLKSGGQMYIETPTAGTKAFYKDPTHIFGWIEETFRYYCDWNTCAANQRQTWNMVSCETKLKGDENEFIICILEKP